MAAGPRDGRVEPNRDVFVSYATHDAALALSVVAILERHKISCWIAPRDVVPGSLYADGIARAINGAKAFVLVLSAHSVASPHVGKEIERASSKRRPIIALHTDSAPLTPAYEYFLSESQWIELRRGELDSPTADRLVAAVLRHREASAAANEPAARGEPVVTGRAAAARRTRWMAAGSIAVLALAFAYVVIDDYLLTRRPSVASPAAPLAAGEPAPSPAASAIPERSIAVLPFADMSEKKDQEYFADGLSEELIGLLSDIPQLRVPARTSSFYFKGKSDDVATIARRLMVAHVLEGSVRRSGNQLRVTAQLVRADNGYHVWSASYDRKIDEIFKVQDEIAGAVVRALVPSLIPGTSSRTARTGSIEAYTLYLRGRYTRERGNNAADASQALEYLQRAAELDPGFALAWAELCRAHLDRVVLFPVRGEVEAARAASAHALAVGPDSAEAHVCAGKLRVLLDWDWPGAEAEFQHALKLDSGNPGVLRAASDLPQMFGRFDEALALLARAEALDPLDANTRASIGELHYFAGRYAAAEAAAREALALDPGRAFAHWNIAMTLLERDRAGDALAEMQHETPQTGETIGLAIVYHALGRKAESDAAMLAAEREYRDDPGLPYANYGAFYTGMAHAYRGDVDQAFEWFERAYVQRDAAMTDLKVHPLLRNVARDPRYKALLRRMHLPD